MTHPITPTGLSPVGTPGGPELRIARLRGHARRLFLPAVIFVAVAGACGYLYGNLQAPLENWMLLTAAAIIVFFFCVMPFLFWSSRTYTITTQRVIARWGVFAPKRRELTHVRGYAVTPRRGILQRMWGCGTLVLSNGVDDPIKISNVKNPHLAQEVLSDQVEINQILAHREGQEMAP